MSKIYEAWLRQARQDLTVAKHLAEHGFHDWACFTAQQSAEKLEKAYYYALGITPEKTHDLAELSEGWRDTAADDLELAADQAFLTRLERDARYPTPTEPTIAPFERIVRSDSQRAIVYVEKLFAICEPLVSRANDFWTSLRPGAGERGGGS